MEYIKVLKINEKTFVVADKVIAISQHYTDGGIIVLVPMGNQLQVDKEYESEFLYRFDLVRTDSGIQYRKG